MNILLLSGSFHSHSKSLLLADFVSRHLADHHCETPRLDQLPFYSEDLNQDKPDSVLDFLGMVVRCNAILCITPEYNHGIPAVLKNALDWASRPAFQSPLKDKPATIISQADSPVGGARVQAQLKLVLDSTLSIIFPAHEMMITGISKAVDSNGLHDADVRRRILRHVDGFLAFSKRTNAVM